MKKIKRTLTVTKVQRAGEAPIEIIGSFNMKQYLREGYSISAPMLAEVEISEEKFFMNADTVKWITNGPAANEPADDDQTDAE